MRNFSLVSVDYIKENKNLFTDISKDYRDIMRDLSINSLIHRKHKAIDIFNEESKEIIDKYKRVIRPDFNMNRLSREVQRFQISILDDDFISSALLLEKLPIFDIELVRILRDEHIWKALIKRNLVTFANERHVEKILNTFDNSFNKITESNHEGVRSIVKVIDEKDYTNKIHEYIKVIDNVSRRLNSDSIIKRLGVSFDFDDIRLEVSSFMSYFMNDYIDDEDIISFTDINILDGTRELTSIHMDSFNMFFDLLNDPSLNLADATIITIRNLEDYMSKNHTFTEFEMYLIEYKLLDIIVKSIFDIVYEDIEEYLNSKVNRVTNTLTTTQLSDSINIMSYILYHVFEEYVI